MCIYLVMLHGYSGCKLRDYSRDEANIKRFESYIPWLLARERGDGSTPEVEQHFIKEKNVLQCQNALNDPRLKHIPEDKRICENPTSFDQILEELALPQWTLEVGDCPVCIAVEETLKRVSDVVIIRPKPRVPTRLQPSYRARPGPSSPTIVRDKRQPSHLQLQDKSLGGALDSVDEPGVGPGVTDNLEKAARGAKETKHTSLENTDTDIDIPSLSLPVSSSDPSTERHQRESPISINPFWGPFWRKDAPPTIASSITSPSLFSGQFRQGLVSDGTFPIFSGYNAEPPKRALGTLESEYKALSEDDEEPRFNDNQVAMPSFDEAVALRSLRALTESEMSGGTLLYHAVHQGFKAIIDGLSTVNEPDYEITENVQSVLSFKFWIEAQLTRLNIWSDEVGAKDSVLDSLQGHKLLDSNSDLQEHLTKYLVSIYEALNLAGQNIGYGLNNMYLVKDHPVMQQFFLKVTKESLTNNLEQVDALLDKLFLLVEPIKIFSALANKSGPYAAVLEAVGKLELDSEDPISNESADTTSLTPVISAEIFADVEQNEIGN